MNKHIIKQPEFNGLVAKICREVTLSNWKPDYVVGITRGGLLPAVMISHYLGVPMNTLNISLRDGGESESNLWMAEDAYGYADASEVPRPEDEPTTDPALRKNILVIDDINDTGATINYLMEDWPSGCMSTDPAWEDIWNQNVKFAVVVDNLASKCNVKMDFVGMEVNKAENDVWIEFPYEEWWTK
jgi:xanthine phosphoribosyltransferase